MLNTVYHFYIIMLAGEILLGFGDAHCGKSQRIESHLVAATAKTIVAIHEHDFQIGYLIISKHRHVAGNLARG